MARTVIAGKTNRKFTAGTAASSFEAVLLLKRQPNSHRSLADAMIFDAVAIMRKNLRCMERFRKPLFAGRYLSLQTTTHSHVKAMRLA
jgi:hypothetical protein